MNHVDFRLKPLSLAVVFLAAAFGVLSQQMLMADWHQTISVEWQKRELRPALEQLAGVGNFNYYLDRRVDPGLLLEMQFQNRPIREILAHIAEQLGLGYAEVGNIAYLGPKETAMVLPLLLGLKQDELSRLPEAVSQNFSTPYHFHSDFLDSPKQVFQAIAKQAKCDPKVFDLLPHDLWPELSFSQASPLELFTVLLGGFDMTFGISRNGKTVTPAPIDREKTVSREYSLSKQEAEDRKTVCPGVSVRTVRGSVRVEGRLDAVAAWDNLDRQQISKKQSDIQPPTTTSTADSPVPFALRRFTATITQQSVRTILASFAKTLEAEIAIDEESFKKKGLSLDQRVSAELKNATLEEALQKCLDPISGTFEISGSKIKVFAK